MVERSRRALVGSCGAASLALLAGCAGLTGGTGGGGEDAEPVDRTGRETVEVAVGAGNGLSFSPANVRIDPGTTVVWEWTGEGGGHNVVDVDGAFESELTDEAGHTFEHAFEEAGVHEYVCTPHQTQGMRGVVEVVE
ncbi:halocyanin domain-containing protein [Halorubrum cibi]|uniref:Halocyanin domain-containing protein n=1 Tax=Halorubrum cibi TaxID=413815 RepID=A0A521D6X0_9EURY|nr:halocyanin domain-containing protein [Halorubrum cibi]SMO67456.1 halocyanin domain-containing protein [Halorubrum cibi]